MLAADRHENKKIEETLAEEECENDEDFDEERERELDQKYRVFSIFILHLPFSFIFRRQETRISAMWFHPKRARRDYNEARRRSQSAQKLPKNDAFSVYIQQRRYN